MYYLKCTQYSFLQFYTAPSLLKATAPYYAAPPQGVNTEILTVNVLLIRDNYTHKNKIKKES